MTTERRAAPLLLLAAAAFVLPACAANPAPEGWRPPAQEAERTVQGGWIVVKWRAGDVKQRLEGELIAVDEKRLDVLTASGLRSVPREQVGGLKLVGYGTEGTSLGLWTLLGTVSTLSHGGFLLLTAPLWLIAGTAAAVGESNAGFAKPEELAKYARFPQGLPPGLDPAALGRLPERSRRATTPEHLSSP